MLSKILLNFIFGVLETIILLNLHRYCWFLPSPFNTDWLKGLYESDDYAHEYPFNSHLICVPFVTILFIIQLLIPFGCVLFRGLLTSQLYISDMIMICAIPTIYLLCLHLSYLWTDFNGNQIVQFIVYPGSTTERDFESKLKYGLEQKYQDVSMELIKSTNQERQGYQFQFKARILKDSRINSFITEMLISLGILLTFCLAGGGIGYLLLLK